MPSSITNVTANAQQAASTILPASSSQPGTRPRARRENVFSSRSSASRPDASRTQTNISETATASATANVSSGVRRPLRIVSGTWTGRSTVLRTSLKRSMFATPSAAKFCTGLILSRSSLVVAGELVADTSRLLAFARPMRSKCGAEDADLAAVGDRVDVAAGDLRDLAGERGVGLGELGGHRRAHEGLLQRVAVVDDLDARRLQAALDSCVDEVRRDDQPGERLARAHLLERLLAVLDVDALDGAEELVGVRLDVDRLGRRA